jgi:hypothetical protein
MKVANCEENSTKSSCDCMGKIMMKNKYINEMKLSELTQRRTTGKMITRRRLA